jgi:4-alpha-glucanotransferase
LSTAPRTRDALRRLASAHGISLSYTSHGGRRVRTSTDAIVATLHALGVAVSSERSIDEQLAAVSRERCDRPLEPVVVMRHAGALSSAVTMAAATEPSACSVVVIREDGEVLRERLSDVVVSAESGEGATRSLTLNLARLGLPAGYHELAIEGPGVAAEALLLVAPRPSPSTTRSFGVFAPIYGLRGRSDWGVGTFTDLANLADHVGALGAAVVGTLPMFPIFFTPPVDPSPYLPVSRLFVNELFIDVEALPEFAASDEARALAGSADLRRDLATLSQAPSVDYGEVMARKRRVLEACAAELDTSPATGRRGEFEAFLGGHPELASYSDFRAAGERLGTGWRDWPSEPGRLPEGAVDPAAQRYHRYVQFAASEQLAAAAAGEGNRAGLYLDLPVGVHPDGFDTWSRAALFAAATVGAPPDRLAPEGQAWGFPPMHPQRIRHERYRYVISCFRNLLAHARVIRIDHVLGLQRVFWIPEGASAESGAYVHYPREELMAIIALEASRANAVVVGEDLGTVPAGIRQAMDRDAMLHSFVYQFAASSTDPLPQPRSPSMASLGSHDLPRFAAFWQGADIDDRVARGVTTKPAAAAEHVERQRLVGAVTRPLADRSIHGAFTACVGSLAAGPAPYVMVDLADLEGETEPDNRPGTGPESGNWRRRLPRPLGAVVADDRITAALTAIATKRAEPQGVSA